MAASHHSPEARYSARLDMLYGISKAVLGARSLQEIVDVALERLAGLVPYWRASVTLFHFDVQEVSVYAAGGPGRDVTPPGARIPLSEFRADLDRLRRGEVDVARGGEVHGAGHASGPSAGRSMRGHLIAPMRWEQELMGSLNLLAVSDTGIGIPAHQLPHLFEVFTPAHREVVSAGRGSGLGLALTRDLCRLMGGDIEVETREGQGTVFTIRLPG